MMPPMPHLWIRWFGMNFGLCRKWEIYSAKPAGDTLAVANRVMADHREMLDALSAEEKHSSGSPWELQQGSPLQFDVTDQVTASGTYTATFQWKNGPSALKIHSVRLYEGNREVASDVHEGRTGVRGNKDNIYRLELKKYRTNLDSYILKAEVSGVSGASKGEMVLKNWWIEKWTGSCAGMGEKAVIRAGFSICFGISLFPGRKKEEGDFPPFFLERWHGDKIYRRWRNNRALRPNRPSVAVAGFRNHFITCGEVYCRQIHALPRVQDIVFIGAGSANASACPEKGCLNRRFWEGCSFIRGGGHNEEDDWVAEPK